jgi:hypothetical protein
MELVPGEHALVVKDILAFEAHYGVGHRIAGQYQGSLSNGGERLVLQDAIGQVIADFTYQDSWYDSTDGEGFSLTVVEPLHADGLSQQEAWRPSNAVGGSPGG